MPLNRLSRKNTNTEQEEHMDLLMKAIKAVHSSLGTSDVDVAESLNHQRKSQERFSKLITPAVSVRYERSDIHSGIKNQTIPAEWAIPEFAHRNDKIILYCHGGGYTCGGLGYAAILAGKLANHTGLKVLGFEYRLAPENPYPAAIEDATSVWNYLMYMGYGAKDIFIAGDSAGGNLAMELILILKAQKRQLPLGLILMSPWTDMTATLPAYEKYKDVDPLLTKEYVLGVRKAYAGGIYEEDIYKTPEFSPLFADLSGFPPTFIQVGSNEILRGDSEELYKKLKKQNINCRLETYNGGWHVFQQMPTQKSSKALDDVKEFIDARI